MTDLARAIQAMHLYYTANDDLEGFFSDLAILAGEDDDLRSAILSDLEDAIALDAADD